MEFYCLLKSCNITNKQEKKYKLWINPKSPILTSQIKLQTEKNVLIRLIIISIKALTYKLATMLQIQPKNTLNRARTYKIEILYQRDECVMIYSFLRIAITAWAQKEPFQNLKLYYLFNVWYQVKYPRKITRTITNFWTVLLETRE